MNILPKKSWHVRTKRNIERVRQDEAKAAEDEKQRLQRIAIAEQEARTDLLRQRARKREHDDTSDHQVEVASGSRHINFFQDLEEGKKVGGTNKEYEEEKKAEKEKQEKSIGLLTYLGQSALEAQTSKPWYAQPPKRQRIDPPQKKPTKNIDEEFELKKKLSQDPMVKMVTYLSHKKKREKDKDKSSDMGHKHRHKHKHRVKEKERSRPSSSGSKSIEQLRAERLRREKEEREKTEKLLAKLRGEKTSEPQDSIEIDDRKRRYNSQFNPDLARKPKASDDTFD